MQFTTLDVLAASYRRHLLAENKSARTVETYGDAVRLFVRHLADGGHSLQADAVTPADVEGFMAHLLSRQSPGTASNRYRALKVFFKWLVAEGEMAESPMGNLKPPRVPECPPDVLTADLVRRLLKACEGTGFAERRDTALMLLFLDTGIRRGEMAALRLSDVDLQISTIAVMGKGRRPRTIAYGKRAGQALDRYLRVRSRHTHADCEGLWIGRFGDIKPDALRLIIGRRCRAAGIPPIHPHLFRHTYAHLWLAQGGNEGDLMQLAGWRSRQMLNRYGASAAAARAREAHKKYSPADNL